MVWLLMIPTSIIVAAAIALTSYACRVIRKYRRPTLGIYRTTDRIEIDVNEALSLPELTECTTAAINAYLAHAAENGYEPVNLLHGLTSTIASDHVGQANRFSRFTRVCLN